MLNEIEESVIAILASADSGLCSDDTQAWYVPAANITRHPPDLQGNIESRLPAVSFDVVEFSVSEEEFSGVGELQKVRDELMETRRLEFDLLYHLDVWAVSPDQANAITQKAIELLLRARESIEGQKDDYRLLSIRPAAGRNVLVELAKTTVFRRQLDYRIECELLVRTPRPTIKNAIVEQIGWQIPAE